MKKQTPNVESLTSHSQRRRWHNAGVRREGFRGLGGRLAGSVAAALVAACVTIAPAPTTTPVPTPAAITSRPTVVPPTPTPTASVTPTPVDTHEGATRPPGSATPGPTIDPALMAQIDAVIAQVPAIRDLEALADVPYEFISREQFRDDLIELQVSEVSEERFRAEERLLKRLGLLPEDADLLDLLLDLYGAQVAAFYRPDTKTFYIIERDQPFGPTDKIIVAHEYTHALQDQHFDLEGTRIKDLSEGDAALAQLAAVEGDATKTMQLWALENLTPEEAVQVLFESLGGLQDPTLSSMPPILRRQLEFPYAEGFAFTQGLYDIGGFDAVDATLSDAIPASTEQILHPEKYTADEEPEAIDPPDVSAQLGEGWQLAYEQTMGELIMQVWAAGDEAPTDTVPGLLVEWPHAETVAGWGGDRLSMYEHPDGRWVIDWELTWDTPDDGLEFLARAEDRAPTFGGPSLIPGSNIVLVASDQEVLDAFVDLR